MLAPVTGVSTYTFNSPGVLQILRKYSSSPQKLRPGQEVVTFIANGDAVGNFRWEDDFGKKEARIFLSILGSEYSVPCRQDKNALNFINAQHDCIPLNFSSPLDL
jgi:hypothetical protein